MDKKQIDEIEAGGELDAFVAEKVMGWKHGSFGRYKVWNLPSGGQLTDFGLPEYSTDIAKAWQTVEKLEKQGFLFRITRLGLTTPPGLEWQAEFRCLHPIQGGHVFIGDALTAPLAICRAALLADLAGKTIDLINLERGEL